jgi:hypothetical protein
VAGKTAILSVEILADARDATKGFEDAGKAASSAADKIDSVGGKAGDTATGLGALSGALDAAGFGPAATALNLTATAMDAAEGSTILFKVAQESLNITTLKATASKVADTVATWANTAASYAAQAASKAWAAAQWLLNAAMTANPIGLIIAGIVLLIGVIVLIATKTTWFQDLWETVWGAIQAAAGAVWRWLTNAATNAWSVIVAGVRGFLATWTSIFDTVKSAAETVWEAVKSAGKTALDAVLDPIKAVKKAFDTVVDAISSVIDWLGKIKLPKVLTDIGETIGGIFGRSAPGAGTRSYAPPAAGVAASARGLGRATGAAAGGGTVNVYVPEVSDPVATARYLKALMRRGQAAGVMFGTL